MRKKSLIGLVLVVAFALCLGLDMAKPVWAQQKFPSRPITIFVTFAPGGISDITARIWARFMEKYLPGATVVVDHKPGGGGVVGYTFVANARPDGYTLLNSGDFFTPILEGTATYKVEDLAVIAQVALNGCVLAVGPDAPWKTFQEFVDYAKKNPGAKWAHQGVGTSVYFRTQNLNKQAGLKLIGVPMKGDSEIISALLGKHVAIGSLSAGMAKAQADAGKLRILFSFDQAKGFGLDPSLPYMATMFPNAPDIEVGLYLVAPKNTPKDVMDILEKTLEKMTKDPEFISETMRINQMVSFVPGKVVMEQRIPKKMELVRSIMKEEGLIK
ncbi:MAG TPA: tripartite tricarboxylate transporter substrate binding protein [Syntrophorhabdaceae bacterium]|nr:tripartite tricarboxylate transporter substrate binding protein [Syntrophorhabdaceae bacterium]